MRKERVAKVEAEKDSRYSTRESTRKCVVRMYKDGRGKENVGGLQMGKASVKKPSAPRSGHDAEDTIGNCCEEFHALFPVTENPV